MSHSENNRVRIFDTTLRDGEQSPGASMTLEEKLKIAEVLEGMNVDIIEAGFAIASNGDFECVKQISERIKNSTICSLARAALGDIERAAEALKPAKQARIHTFIATSPLHMRVKLQMDPEDVISAIHGSVTHARKFVDDVEWSAEDATRTDLDFLYRAVETAIRAGATTINLPDTVGYATPTEFEQMFRSVIENVPDSDKAIFSTHCHNDLGLAVANSLAGLAGGARQIECTINGIGERAGNAAMEEIVMALKTRADAMPYHTNIKTTDIMKASKLVSTVTGFTVQNNKAIVGANAFAHEAGIHQDGILKDAQTYEIMTPESVGVAKSTLAMGKHSGRHAFADKLAELGYELGDNAFQECFRRFKELGDRKKTIYDEDIIALVDDEVATWANRMQVVALNNYSSSNGHAVCDITMTIDGDKVKAVTYGSGPVDAAFNAIKDVIEFSPKLQHFQVHAVTHGTDAQAECTVRLEHEGRTANGQGADEDTVIASARAYVSAVNKLLVKREKKAPGPV
ncbi:MAG: 2-isopropylmalate synthase [Kordiimonadaceae bacterium]|uniref:2-isopropylmalate synthase n=1 Tax=Aerophobetes bacterium TaxID=2030807 RepID=A0A2A4YLH2_UNCAE|nr:2-isopropylmalate synthase [Kordiimonadaceae bacterium]PCI95177.1 MAG: 2-isopropylmalate synthase [Candidatus Aerophobetes bacterium]